MSSVLTGLVFLLVAAGVYHHNTVSHDSQVIFPTLSPDETVAVLGGIGVFLIASGAFRWLRRQPPPPGDPPQG